MQKVNYFNKTFREEWANRDILEIEGIKVPTYICNGTIDPEDHSTEIYKHIIANKEKYLGKKFLDIGCCAGINNILLTKAGFEVVGIDNNIRSINCSLYVMDLNDVHYEVILADETYIEEAEYDVLIVNQMGYMPEFVKTMIPIMNREQKKGKEIIAYK